MEVFENTCPYYIAMGMTYAEYWDGDVRMHRHIRKAYKVKQENAEYEAWLHGVYVRDAIASCFSDKKKPYKYPKQPYTMLSKKQKKENVETEDERERKKRESDDMRFNAYMIQMMSEINKVFKDNGNTNPDGEEVTENGG